MSDPTRRRLLAWTSAGALACIATPIVACDPRNYLSQSDREAPPARGGKGAKGPGPSKSGGRPSGVDGRPQPERSPPGASSVTLERVKGPVALNSRGRGLFASVRVDRDKVQVAYLVARKDTITDDKSLFKRSLDRNLGSMSKETVGIEVRKGKRGVQPVFQGDLGDHKIVRMGDYNYFVAIVKGSRQAVVLKYDDDFRKVAGPAYVGDPSKDRMLDMGLGTDGSHIYVQFFHSAGKTPSTWAAKIIKLDSNLKKVKETVVRPESGTFVTGTSIVYVPGGKMGARQDRMQIFSTNLDYGNKSPVGIHTFAIDTRNLSVIRGSTRTIVQRNRDVYFPTGPSWNERHQVWILGYTMEKRAGAFPKEELGPSYVSLFDETFNEITTVPVNDGNDAMRVMTATEGDDVYVVYDEMGAQGRQSTSKARIEHFKLSEQ